MNQQSLSSISLENTNIKLNVEKQSGCKVIFSITTLPAATKAAEAAAVKAVTKEVNIPGFRKGRAPEALVSSQFAPQIKKEFGDILTRNAFSEAIKLSGIHPLSNESPVNLTKCEPIDATSFLIEIGFDAYPEIPSIDPSALSVARQEAEPVTQDLINKHIEELRLHHCSWKEVTDRAAQDGDFVTVNIDMMEDGIPKTVHEGNRFQMKEDKLPAWLRKLITGLSIGGTATGTSEDEREDKSDNFTPRTFNVELLKIEEAVLPEVDEALAKKAGVESVDALNKAIEKSLAKDAAERAKQTMRFAAKKAILANYPMELPGSRLKDLLNECTQLSQSDNSLSKEEQDNKMMGFFNQGKDNMTFSYLVYKLFKDNNLKYPTTQEVRQRATEEMLMRYMSGDRNISENDLEYFTRTAENEMIAATALDFVVENSKRA